MTAKACSIVPKRLVAEKYRPARPISPKSPLNLRLPSRALPMSSRLALGTSERMPLNSCCSLTPAKPSTKAKDRRDAEDYGNIENSAPQATATDQTGPLSAMNFCTTRPGTLCFSASRFTPYPPT